jgi:hypothetical protein
MAKMGWWSVCGTVLIFVQDRDYLFSFRTFITVIKWTIFRLTKVAVNYFKSTVTWLSRDRKIYENQRSQNLPAVALY